MTTSKTSKISACLCLATLVLSPGCYQTSGPMPSTDAGPDVEVGDGSAEEELDVPMLCERLCTTWSTSACPMPYDSCMTGCFSRAELSERRECVTEWKAITECIIDTPCSHGSCGPVSGWPECIGARD